MTPEAPLRPAGTFFLAVNAIVFLHPAMVLGGVTVLTEGDAVVHVKPEGGMVFESHDVMGVDEPLLSALPATITVTGEDGGSPRLVFRRQAAPAGLGEVVIGLVRHAASPGTKLGLALAEFMRVGVKPGATLGTRHPLAFVAVIPGLVAPRVVIDQDLEVALSPPGSGHVAAVAAVPAILLCRVHEPESFAAEKTRQVSALPQAARLARQKAATGRAALYMPAPGLERPAAHPTVNRFWHRTRTTGCDKLRP
jgi:hypothetical protein